MKTCSRMDLSRGPSRRQSAWRTAKYGGDFTFARAYMTMPRTNRAMRLDSRAAADLDDCAVDVARFVGSQESISIGDLFRPREPAKRHTIDHCLHDFLRNGSEYGGFDEARTHRVGSYALAPQFPCPGLRHPDHAEFARRVIG